MTTHTERQMGGAAGPESSEGIEREKKKCFGIIFLYNEVFLL